MNPTDKSDGSRFGFVAVLGAPNAGKSSLVNHFVGQKVSIVSNKVQTTRARVIGIMIADKTQIAFIDTPGIFKAKRKFEHAMVNAAWDAGKSADLNFVVVDVADKNLDQPIEILDNIKKRQQEAQTFLLLNKIDKIARPQLLRIAQVLNEGRNLAQTLMISVKKDEGLDGLIQQASPHMPAGPWHYPADQISTLPERFFAAEITREQIFIQLMQELPYATHVETELWEDKRDKSVKINQVIYVKRPAHKVILIGKNGGQIKAIGEEARKALETHLERKVHLFLFVKVRENWEDNPETYAMHELR